MGINLRMMKGTCTKSTTALPAAAPAGGTGATAGAYDTAAHRDELIATVNDLRTIVNELRTQQNLIIDALNA